MPGSGLGGLARRLVAGLRGQSVDEMRSKCETWWLAEVKATIAPPALTTIELHRKRGEKCVLLTGGTQFVAEPLGRELCVDGILCSRLSSAMSCL